VALCIDEQPFPYRKVLIEGEAELVHDVGEDASWRELYLAMGERYAGREGAEAYVGNTIREPRGLFRVRLAKASSVRTWRMPIEGEPAMGIWHARYYHEGTEF
jgi:hypothetical protein